MHRLLVIGVAALAALTLCGPGAAWTWPADGQVLRPFGMAADPYAGGQHRGIDVAGADGSTIRAPAAGTVTFAGSVPTHGRGVTIQTDDGYAVTLVHLGTIGVEKGAVVAEGDPIGTMGSSGTPEHPVPSVHLGIRPSSDAEGYVDPLGLLPPRAVPVPTSGPAQTPAPSASPVAQPVAPPAPPAASQPPEAAPSQPAAPVAAPPAASPVPAESPVPAVQAAASSPTPETASPGAADSARAASSAPAPLGTAGPIASGAGAGVTIAASPPGSRRRSNGFAAGGSARPERRSARRARHRSEGRRPCCAEVGGRLDLAPLRGAYHRGSAGRIDVEQADAVAPIGRRVETYAGRARPDVIRCPRPRGACRPDGLHRLAEPHRVGDITACARPPRDGSGQRRPARADRGGVRTRLRRRGGRNPAGRP